MSVMAFEGQAKGQIDAPQAVGDRTVVPRLDARRGNDNKIHESVSSAAASFS